MTEEEKEKLNKIIAKPSSPQSIALRARILLLAKQGAGIKAIALALGIVKNTVKKWLNRWSQNSELDIIERLQDLPRSGCPDKFTPEQICKIIATCCESPSVYGRPITH